MKREGCGEGGRKKDVEGKERERGRERERMGEGREGVGGWREGDRGGGEIIICAFIKILLKIYLQL